MATGSEMYYGAYKFDSPVPIIDSYNEEIVYSDALERNFIRRTMELSSFVISPSAASGRLDYLFTERDSIANALASGNQQFSIYWNGDPVLSGVYPRVTSLSFSDDIWSNKVAYNFSLEWDVDFYGSGIQSFTDSWQFEENEDRRTVNARHDVSAVGINTEPSGTNNALTNAKTYVLSKTGWKHAIAGTPGFASISGTYSAYEETGRTETADSQAGSYAVSEVIILGSGTYIHTDNHSYAIDTNGVVTVTINGNIRGFGRGDNAYNRALSAWPTVRDELPSVASGVYADLSGEATLYTHNFESLSITKNQFAGTLEYTASYTDAGSESLPSGVLDFSLNVVDNKPVRLYASFPIAERALGNVVQDISTSTEGTFTITGNSVGKPSFPYASLLSWTEGKINTKRPQSANYQTLRLSQNQINKDEDNRTVNFNLVWTYTVELSNVQPDADDITLN